MRARSRCALGLLLAAALLTPGCNWLSARPDTRPDVLLVTIDTLRADHVGAYGAKDVATPTLDALAARGARFTEAMAVAPLTLPSHASMLTGLYPPSDGVRHNSIHRLSDDVDTVAERFHAAGYATGAVVGAAVLAKAFGLDQGFDHYDDTMGPTSAAAAGYPERKAGAVTDAALSWLRGARSPYFLWVHYYDVHANYDPPEPYRTRFAGHEYDGEAAYVDVELGRLLAGLRARGRLDHTVILVTADHGEGLGQHGEKTHSYLIYDCDIHVPLLIAGPGVPAGIRIDTVVSGAAVAPTLLALAGVPGLAHTDVPSLTPLLVAGGSRPGGRAYSETLAGRLDHGWAPLYGVRTEGKHYIRAPRSELYDMRSDPGELHNLLPKHSDDPAVARADARIDGLLADARVSERHTVDAQTRAQMEALGYVVPRGDVFYTGEDPKDVHELAELVDEAMALDARGRWNEAERVALSALKRLPDSAQLQDVLAQIYSRTHRFAKALPHAERAAALQPESAELQAQLGYVRMRLGDYAGAVEAFQAAALRDPHAAGAQVGLMWRVRAGGTVAEAEQHAKRALELSGGIAPVYEGITEVWERLGEYERARRVLEAGLKAHPEARRLHMRAAIQAARLGDEARVRTELAAAGKAARDVELRNRLGIAYAARGDTARALAVFQDVLREWPQQPETRRLLARLQAEMGAAAPAPAAPAPAAQGAGGATSGPGATR